MISNDNLPEQITDDTSSPNNETTLDLGSLTLNDEPVDDRTKYSEKRRLIHFQRIDFIVFVIFQT